MRLIGGKVIPVVLEVYALATLNQRFRCGPVKAEVPEAGVVVDGFPLTDTREESITTSFSTSAGNCAA